MIDPKEVFKFDILKVPPHTHCQGTCYSTSWTVPNDLPYLRGHFPTQPVLPAVAMIDASFELLRQASRETTNPLIPIGVSSAKFAAPVTPEMQVEITLHQIADDTWQADWREASRPADGCQQPAAVLAKIQFTTGTESGFSR